MQAKLIFREPLLHFVLIGAVLFGVAELRRRGTAGAEDRTITVDAHVQRQLAESFQAANGRPPSAEEIRERVERQIDEEVLYREGVARGLHQDDARVRQRVAEKMAFVIEARIVVPPPSDEELRKFFDANHNRYAKPELVDFIHVFVSGSDAAASERATELLERLQRGTDPNGLGDRFSGGRRYRGRKLADLAATFGSEFVQGMHDQALDTWAERRSRFGFHLVKIEKRTPPKSPSFEEVKLELAKDWEAEQRGARYAAALAELRKGWRIVR